MKGIILFLLFQLINIVITSLNSFLFKRNLQQSLTIINYEISVCDSPSSLGVTIQLFSGIEDQTENENFQGTLLSPSKKELKSTSCILDNSKLNITCTFNFTEEGVYYLKAFTSNSYTYYIKAPLITQIRIGESECKTEFDTNSYNKKDSFLIKTESCIPEIYIAKENSDIYYSLSCYKRENNYKCSYPSNLEINGESENIQIYGRGKCGNIDNLLVVSVADISIEGDKYLNIQNSLSEYYYIITSSVEGSFEFIGRDQSIIQLNNCTTLQSKGKYKYNCTISNENNVDIYDLKTIDGNIILHEAIIVYEPDEIKIKSIELDNYSSSNNTKTATLQFDDELKSIDDTFENKIRGFKLESNSQKAMLNTCNISPTNSKLVECKLIVEDNCTLSFYYKNRTEQYVLMNKESIKIGTGNPYYTDNYILLTVKLDILIILLLLFI